MRVVPIARRNPRSFYRILAARDGITITLTHDFWSEGFPIYDQATDSVGTELDANVDAVCEELRYALYYIALGEQQKH